jgi:hypothetical protein
MIEIDEKGKRIWCWNKCDEKEKKEKKRKERKKEVRNTGRIIEKKIWKREMWLGKRNRINKILDK